MFRQPSTHSTLHDPSSSEDEEDHLLREEQEQERLLSEQHGEANETPVSGTSRKRQSDAEIADALNSNDASSKKKKPRMVLTDEKLVGVNGLIRVRHEFGSKVCYRQPKPINTKNLKDKKAAKRKLFERDIKASAMYASKLMNSYREFAMDIAPNMHYNDTFLKIQELGKKKIVREYLNTMRLEVCREHLEKMHGRDKAETIMNELDNGLKLSRDEFGDELTFDDVGGIGTHRSMNLSEASNSVERSSLNAPQTGKESSAAESQRRNKSSDKGDDENEASFDDVVPPSTGTNFNEGNNSASEELAEPHVDGIIRSERPNDAAEYSDEDMELEEPCADDTITETDVVKKGIEEVLEQPHASDSNEDTTETNNKENEDSSTSGKAEALGDDVICSESKNDKNSNHDASNEEGSLGNDQVRENAENSTDSETGKCDMTEHSKGDDLIDAGVTGGNTIQDTGPQIYDNNEDVESSRNIVEIPQTQETMMSDHSHIQSGQDTKNSLVFDGTQITQTRGFEGDGTQDTLVLDLSQAHEDASIGNSQDY